MTLLIRTLDVAPTPWKNGAGSTRELLARPAGNEWRVRISVADVDHDAPFSAFPGVQRWFAVLKGAGVELSIGGRPQALRRGDAPLGFDGAADTRCRLLDGPTQDLNLMLRGVDGRMDIAADGVEWQPPGRRAGLFTAVAGRCHAGADVTDLPAYALLWFDRAPASLIFNAGERPAAGVGWWLHASEEGSR